MGNPDSPTPPHIVAKLVEAVQDPRTHRYSVSKGIPGLRRALAGYYARRFDVELDPETEVIATLGSKEGLANLAVGHHVARAIRSWCRTRPIRSTSSASSSPAPRCAVRPGRARTRRCCARWTARCGIRCRSRPR